MAAPDGVLSLGNHWRSLLRAELVLPALLVFLLSVPVFARLIGGSQGSVFSDYPAHLNNVVELAEGGHAPPHPLFHYCVVVFSFGDNRLVICGIAAMVLALALAGRAYLTALFLTARNPLNLGWIIVACLALALVMPLPNWWSFPADFLPWESAMYKSSMPTPGWWSIPSVYRGQLAANVWHNPTGLFAMPFCVLAFVLGLRALQSPSNGRMAGVALAMVLTLLAKPNYVLAFAPCFGMAAAVCWVQAIRTGRLSAGEVVGQAALAFGPVLFVLWQQYRHAYGDAQAGASGVRIAPFAAWNAVARNIPVTVVLGLAFPLTVAALYRRDVVNDRPLALAWCVMLVALLEFALLIETGPRADHGNFGWGAIAANQVLFIACCEFLLRQPVSNARNAAFIVLFFHVLSGSLCLARCLFVPPLANAF